MNGWCWSLNSYFLQFISFGNTFFAWTHEQILVYQAITYDEVHILYFSLTMTEGKLLDIITLKIHSFFFHYHDIALIS